ncbi:hypothetical protein R1sor_006233 [Riccia sorocarpa]|uniref:Uncharacterized protein n=1 Tax=Riccia sorocarpa TaxID=122646 RepID=A0ABD3HM07_9MARC
MVEERATMFKQVLQSRRIFFLLEEQLRWWRKGAQCLTRYRLMRRRWSRKLEQEAEAAKATAGKVGAALHVQKEIWNAADKKVNHYEERRRNREIIF